MGEPLSGVQSHAQGVSEKHWRETLTYKQFFAIANKRVHIQSFLVIVIYISEFIGNAGIFAHTIELNILNVDWLVKSE